MLPFVKFKSLQKPFSFTTQREHNDLLYTVCIVLYLEIVKNRL